VRVIPSWDIWVWTLIINKFGTYVVRATEKAEADKLKKDALLLAGSRCICPCIGKIPLVAKE